MDFIASLYKRKAMYEDELLLAKAKIDVISDIIADYEAKEAEETTVCEEETAQETEVVSDETY